MAVPQVCGTIITILYLFGMNMCITTIEIHFRCKTIEGIIQINRVTIILLKWITVDIIQSCLCSKQTPNNNYLGFNTNLDGRGSVRCLIISTLETLPTYIVSSPLASLHLFRSFYFELLTLSNRTGIQYPGATRSTSKVHINIMYIQYTSIDLASLLIYQVSGVILLQWLFPLLQKHLVSGLGSTLGFH